MISGRGEAEFGESSELTLAIDLSEFGEVYSAKVQEVFGEACIRVHLSASIHTPA